MRKLVAVTFFLLTYLAPAQLVPWAVSCGGTGNDAAASAALYNGTLFIAGTFFNSADFGNFRLSSVGAGDVYVAAFDVNTGQVLWATSAGSMGDDGAACIAADPDGGIYVAGRFSLQLAFKTFTLVSKGQTDAFMIHFKKNGVADWGIRGGGAGIDQAMAVSCSPSGVPAVSGCFQKQAVFGTHTLTASGNNSSAFVFTGDSATKNVSWAKSFGNNGFCLGSAVSNDTASIFLAGTFEDQLQVGSSTLTSQGQEDVFIAKLREKNGDVQWASSFGGDGSENISKTALAADRLLMAGKFETVAYAGSLTVVSNGGSDMFAGCISTADGQFRWMSKAGGASADNALDIGIGNDGKLLVGGLFNGFLEVGGNRQYSNGNSDAILLTLDSASGHVEHAFGWGGLLPDACNLVAGIENGVILCGGTFQFGIAPGGHSLSAKGSNDIFLLRMDGKQLGNILLSKQENPVIYPVPCDDSLFIDPAVSGSVEIRDLGGRLVLASGTVGSALPVGFLASGTYLVTLRNADGRVFTGRFCKN